LTGLGLRAQGDGNAIETSVGFNWPLFPHLVYQLLETLDVPIKINQELRAFLFGFIWFCLEGIRAAVEATGSRVRLGSDEIGDAA